MTRQQPGDGDGTAAAPPEAGSTADGPGRRILVSSLRRLSGQQSDGELEGSGGAFNAEPSPAGSRRNSRGGGGSTGGGRKTSDAPAALELNKLLGGGLVGRAMAAAAQWRATQQQLAACEQQERRLLRGEGVSSEAPLACAPAATFEMPQVGSSALLAQLLPPLAEGGEEAEAGEEHGGRQACGTQPSQWQLERAAADDLIAAFPFADQRQYLQHSLAALDSPPPPPTGPEAEASAAGHSLTDPCSAAATSGGDVLAPAAASRLTADPLLAAWMVTRAPPDLPVRGYSPPPGRSACRLIAAKEMREYYAQQQRRSGGLFKWLGLSAVQAGGRGSDVAPMQLTAGAVGRVWWRYA